MKVETDVMAGISESPTGRTVIMNVKTFNTDISAFIDNVITSLEPTDNL